MSGALSARAEERPREDAATGRRLDGLDGRGGAAVARHRRGVHGVAAVLVGRAVLHEERARGLGRVVRDAVRDEAACVASVGGSISSTLSKNNTSGIGDFHAAAGGACA